MVGVWDGKVNQVYTADLTSDVEPFEIGQGCARHLSIYDC